MGGAASGELASSMAGDVVLDALREPWCDAGSPRRTTLRRGAARRHGARQQPHPQLRPREPRASRHGHHRHHRRAAWRPALSSRRSATAAPTSCATAQAQQLTKDQSLMQRLVEAGELTPEEAERSERRNIILQALGPEPQVTVDLTHQQVRTRRHARSSAAMASPDWCAADEIARISRSADADVAGMCQQAHRPRQRARWPGQHHRDRRALRRRRAEHSDAGDTFGYTRLSARRHAQRRAREAAPPRAAHVADAIKSDPTPRYGTPTPTPRAAREQEFDAEPRVDTADGRRTAVLGAPRSRS